MASDKITAAHVLFPVSLLSFVIALFLGFQTTLLVTDRNALRSARTQQDKPLEQVEKLKAQVNALAIGTLHLAEQGNKDAQNIIAELKKAGVDVTDKPPAGSPPAGMPAMSAVPPASPPSAQ